jgi:hypothetical protein
MRPSNPARGTWLTVAAALLILAAPAAAWSQTSSSRTPPAGSQSQAPPPPDNLERIREAVSRPPALKIENGQLRIYVQVIANWPSFAEKTKGYDWINGPTGMGNPMSHQEFLSMVTPKDMYSSGGGIKPVEMLQFALVNYLGQAVIKKGLEEIRKARDEREIEEIRARIDRELAALRGGK